MVETLTHVSLEELVKRLMAGERDFSATRIAPDDNSLETQEGFADLNRYLQEQDLRAEPILAERADWSGLKARGAFLGFSKLAGINLAGADLRGAEFRRSDFTDADLRGANLDGAFFVGCRTQGADLSGSSLRGADFYEASLVGAKLAGCDLTRAFLLRLSLKDADLTGADVTGADMYRCDLRAAIGLDTVAGLGTVALHQTIVTPAERAIVEAALQASDRYDIRDE